MEVTTEVIRCNLEVVVDTVVYVPAGLVLIGSVAVWGTVSCDGQWGVGAFEGIGVA